MSISPRNASSPSTTLSFYRAARLAKYESPMSDSRFPIISSLSPARSLGNHGGRKGIPAHRRDGEVVWDEGELVHTNDEVLSVKRMKG